MIEPPLWEQLLAALYGAGAAKWLAKHGQGDISPCTTRIMREGRGLPWNERVAVHPLKDGRIQITPLYPDENP